MGTKRISTRYAKTKRKVPELIDERVGVLHHPPLQPGTLQLKPGNEIFQSTALMRGYVERPKRNKKGTNWGVGARKG